MSIRIMSEVWSSSAQTGGNLLLLLALADFCNDEGECWPSVLTLSKKARVTDRHVRRILRLLEESGEISKLETPGQNGTIRYKVNMGADKMSGGRGSPPPLTLASVSPDVEVSQSVKNHQEPSISQGEDEISKEGNGFVDAFLTLLRDTDADITELTPSSRRSWAKCYELMRRKDGRTKEEVWAVCKWARNTDFWKKNFLSPMKLRDKKNGVSYYDLLRNQMKNPINATPQKTNSRGFSGHNADALDEYENRMASGQV